MSVPGCRLGLLGALSALQVVWPEAREGQGDLLAVPDQRGWGPWKGLEVSPSCQEEARRLCWAWGGRCLSWPQACQARQGQGWCLGGQGVGRLTIGVHVVTWHLGWREALLEGVAAAVGALLHGHDLLLWWGQWRVGGHHALHAT